jgi:hypothetical protein
MIQIKIPRSQEQFDFWQGADSELDTEARLRSDAPLVTLKISVKERVNA